MFEFCNSVGSAINVSAKTVLNVIKISAHGVIGGLRSVVNGGKFLAGFISGAIGKAITVGSNWLADTSSNVVIKGLVVATAGGLAAELTGGEFAAGFITAGVAFAANHVATNVDKNNTARAYSKLESRLESEGRLDSDSALNLSGDDLKVMSKQMYYEGVSDRDSGLSYVDAKARNADTFLFDNEILSDRSFSVGSGIYHASAVNYIGVGAYSRAYGLNMSLSMIATMVKLMLGIRCNFLALSSQRGGQMHLILRL